MRKLTIEEAKNKALIKGFTLIDSEWHGASNRYSFRCESCLGVFRRYFYNFHTNSSCPFCKKRLHRQYNKLDLSYWQKFANSVGLEVISRTYVSARDPIVWCCLACNTEFSNAPCNVKSGSSCPKCAGTFSKNEEIVRECLQTKTGFKFVRVRPDFLKNPSTGSNLELDGFCEELNMAFEYDGEQHFHSFKHLGGHSRLQKTKDYDKMKNYMCRNNGVKLLRVSYRDISNIDALVDEFLLNNSPNEGF